MLGRLFLFFVVSIAGCLASARDVASDQTFVISLQGKLIGHGSVRSLARPDHAPGRLIETTRVTTFATTTGPNEVRTTTRTWLTDDNDSDRVEISQFSAGRTHQVTISCRPMTLDMDIVSGGILAQRSLARPQESVLVGDVLAVLPILNEGVAAPNLATICPATLKLTTAPILDLGLSKITSFGGNEVRELTLQDSSTRNSIFVDSKGDVTGLRTTSGMEFRGADAVPIETEATAPDLARILSLTLDRAIEKPRRLKELHLRLHGAGNKAPLTDARQTTRREGEDTLIQVRSQRERKQTPLSATERSRYLSAEPLMPVDHPQIQRAAVKMIGEATSETAKARKIRLAVHRRMEANSTIGVARNAVEILNSKTGVCRDAAVLMATLLRSQAIPTRLVGGLIADGTDLRYHAWVEAHIGNEWLPFDPSNESGFFDAGHIKLTAGTYEEAMTIEVVRATKVTVELVRY